MSAKLLGGRAWLHAASGRGARDYPVQRGSDALSGGDISGMPLAAVDGVRLPTQAHVKVRLPEAELLRAPSFPLRSVPKRAYLLRTLNPYRRGAD